MEKEIRELEMDLARQYSNDKYQTICKLKYQLNDVYNKKAEYALFRLRTKFYEGGEKNGRLLVRKLKQQGNLNNISVIKKDNQVVTSSKEINSIFKSFYQDVYTSAGALNEEEVETFFSGLQLPTLSSEQKARLDAPITEEEVRAAISSMKNGKSPGWDGFPT